MIAYTRCVEINFALNDGPLWLETRIENNGKESKSGNIEGDTESYLFSFVGREYEGD